MYQKILLCYDGTREGRQALRQGANVAIAMHSQAYLLAICRDMIASSVPEGVTPELIACEQDTAASLLRDGIKQLADRGVPTKGSLVYGDPLDHIPEVAARIGADLIVVGYRYRHRFARWWSEDEQITLLHKISCSLLVAVPQPDV